MLPSKSGSKYSFKNIMTENIWKIFAPWRGPQIKLLFSTFFQVTVYLVDTQNFRVIWRPLHVFCEYLCKYWSYLIQKNIWHNLLGVVYHVKKVSTIFDENWSQNINLKKECSISWKVIWKPIVQWYTSCNPQSPLDTIFQLMMSFQTLKMYLISPLFSFNLNCFLSLDPALSIHFKVEPDGDRKGPNQVSVSTF